MKYLLLTLIFLINIVVYSQFTIATTDGDPILDNDIFTYNTTTYPNASLDFIVTNTSGSDIDVVITVVSITNADGSQMEICFGSCFSGIVEGNSYPQPAYSLASGASSEAVGNHFFNLATGTDTNVPVTYVFKFHEVDGNGDEVGTPIQISYIYDATSTTAIEDLSQVNFKVYPTLVDEQLFVSTDENVLVSFIDIQGRLIATQHVVATQTLIDVSALKPQLYYLIATNNNGLKTLRKIIIR